MRISARSKLVLGLCLSAALAACSSSSNDDDDSDGSEGSPTIDLVPTVGDSAIGKVYIAGENNRTLYTLTSVDPNTFGCDPTCEANWPPLLTTVTQSGISGQFDVIGRDDSQSQWMLSGYPLYFYTGDAAAGDVTGEGLGDRWFVARPIPVDSASNSGGEEISVASGSVLNADGTRIDKDGFTLYFFANDTDGVSNCDDTCATTWPPLYADQGARGYDRYSLITRTDGRLQWAYDGKALYLYSGDNAAGDTSGDNVGGVWSVVMP